MPNQSYNFPIFPPNPNNDRVYPRIVVNKPWKGSIPDEYLLGDWPDVYMDFDEVQAWLCNEEESHNVEEVPPESNWGTRINIYWGHTAGSTKSDPGAWCVAFVNWAYLHFFKNHFNCKSPWQSGGTTDTWFRQAAREGWLRYYPEDVRTGKHIIRAGDCILWTKQNPYKKTADAQGNYITVVDKELAKEMVIRRRATRLWTETRRGEVPALDDKGQPTSRINGVQLIGCRHISMMTGRRWDNELPTPGEVENPNGDWLEEIQGNTDNVGVSRDGGLVRKKRKNINRVDIVGFVRFHGRSGVCPTTVILDQSRSRINEPIGETDNVAPKVVYIPIDGQSAGNSIVFQIGVQDSSGIKEAKLFWRKAGATSWNSRSNFTTFQGKVMITLPNHEINPDNGLYVGDIQYYFLFKDASPAENITVWPTANAFYTFTIYEESGI